MFTKFIVNSSKVIMVLGLILSLTETTGRAQSPYQETDRPRLGLQAGAQYSESLPLTTPGKPSTQPNAPDTPTAPQLPWSKLVFESYRDGNYEIYLANDDGSGLVRLTSNTAKDIYPRLNRGATRIAFASNRVGSYEIYTMNTDGSSLTRLTSNNKDDVNPTWSPDGSKIAFQSYRDGHSEVYVMNANGSSQTRLTIDAAGYNGEPIWSPDGTKIAFTSYRNNIWRIWVMNANGSGQVQLSQQSYCEDPTWSPDGTQIAFDADNDADGWMELWLMNADGTNQHQVADPPSLQTDYYARSWSPDGQKVGFTRVNWIYQNSQWYWTTSEVMSWNSPWIFNLFPGVTEWYPDWQTIDVLAPVSNVQPLPVQSPGPFLVSWVVTDPGGAGIKDFTVQVRDGAGGAWTDWQVNPTITSAMYPGIGGHTYYFRSRARDNAFNTEAWPPDYDAVTTVEAFPPISAVMPLPAYMTYIMFITWSGTDPGGSGIKSYDVQYKDLTAGGTWTDWQMNTALTSAQFSMCITGDTYAFRARAIDNALNQEAWPASDYGDTTSTCTIFGISGLVMDNTGNPISGASVNLLSLWPPFLTHSSGLDGFYDAYAFAYENLTLNWSKTGYGALPDTVYSVPLITHADVVLPPADDVVVNSGLEFTGEPQAPWLVGGVMLPVTDANFHTGASSVQLGDQTGITEPVDVSDMMDPPYGGNYLNMAVEDDGTTHIVWADNAAIYYARKDTDGNWSTAINISQGTPNNGALSLPPEIVVGKDYAATVFWSPLNGGVLSTRLEPGGSWSTPIRISGEGKCITQGCGVPVAVIDASDTIHLTWNDDNDLYYAQRPTTGTWSVPVSIPHDTLGNGRPMMGVDHAGILRVVFSGHNNTLLYTQRNLDGTWISLETLSVSNGFFQPFGNSTPSMDMSVDQAGNVYVAWCENSTPTPPYSSDLNFASRNAAGGWSPTIKLTNLPTNSLNPSIVVGTDGTLYVVNQESDRIILNSKPAGGSWIGMQDLVPPGQYDEAFDLKLDIDKNGILNVSWDAHYSNFYGIFYEILYIKKVSGSWTQPVSIFRWGSALPYEMDLDGQGNPHFSWILPSFNNHIYYNGQSVVPQTGSAFLSQTVTLPVGMDMPVLSFMYQLGDVTPTNASHFEVQVTQGHDTTTVFSTNTSTLDWTHQWVDLHDWAGKDITVSFVLYLTEGPYPAYARVDDVTIGSGLTDVWVSKSGPQSAFPGNTVTQTIAYGNQGLTSATGVTLTLTLPDKLTFISADVTPTTVNGQVLTWDLADLAGRSGPFAITITATVAADAALFSTIAGSIEIQASSNELEKANNTLAINIFIGAKIFLPIISR
jgi:uncharacterized repeat protein (TIGR01451 family)